MILILIFNYCVNEFVFIKLVIILEVYILGLWIFNFIEIMNIVCKKKIRYGLKNIIGFFKIIIKCWKYWINVLYYLMNFYFLRLFYIIVYFEKLGYVFDSDLEY